MSDEPDLMRYREALEEIYDLAGWNSDDDARADDTSPEDMVAHVNGLIRKLCNDALGCAKESEESCKDE